MVESPSHGLSADKLARQKCGLAEQRGCLSFRDSLVLTRAIEWLCRVVPKLSVCWGVVQTDCAGHPAEHCCIRAEGRRMEGVKRSDL